MAATERYVARLEALDAETERLLESIPDAAAFDDETRAQTRRRLREVRAQLNPLSLRLRSRVDADDCTPRAADDPPRE
ncbi:hypothetical protein BB347_16965 (plasmid) [Natronorubrum daqingense]|uniref:Uncharacterized protein n=1 Tax=Natronorubrum daqingense TaxID=588898 RepID=A0A1P8RIK7_9EURY|nr:hypothetical protein BB347_16965 [Natronorubrum daqingense]